MLRAVPIRDLRVDPAAHPRGQPHLSAASGLVRAGRFLHVVADDENHLGTFDPAGDGLVQLHRLLPGDLPLRKDDRKRRKADFEVLAALPPGDAWPHGALLALGSGSTATRVRGVIVPLQPGGAPGPGARAVDLSAWYAPLRARFPDVNIEGGFVLGDSFCLLQRGNQGNAVNACVQYPLAPVLQWLVLGGAVPLPLRESRFDLGAADGIAFGFTDGTAAPGGGWFFSAVAEDTPDSFADGRCVAAAIGRVGPGGGLEELARVEGAPKIEGLALAGDGGLLAVTDSDDPHRPSRLLALA